MPTTTAVLDERTRRHAERLDDVEEKVDDLETGFAAFKAEVKTAAKFGSMIGAGIGATIVGVIGSAIGGLIVYFFTTGH